MHAPLGLSLAFHLAALGLPMWLPVTPSPPPAPMQVRLVLAPEHKPVEEVPKVVAEPPKPVAQTTTRATAPVSQPLLAGGGAMSEEADEVSAQAAPTAVRSHLAEAGSGGVSSSASQVAGGTWSEASGGALRSDAAQVGPVPARMREVTDTRAVATTAFSSGGQAGAGETAGGSLRAGGRTATAVLARQQAGAVMVRENTGTPALAGGEGGSAARMVAANGAAYLRVAAAGSAGTPEAGVSARASGVDQGETQRLTRSHAQAGAARMADAGAAGRQPASAVPGLPGAVVSAESAAQRHGGPERRSAGLVDIEGGRALDPSALDSAPSNFVFRAALAGDGEACFGYSPSLRRTGLQGLVVLRVRVDVAGRPHRIEIRNSSGVPSLDAHAKDQAERCARFVVHNRKGQAVAATLDLPVRYRFNQD
jgi:TonB family protein